MKYFKLDEFDSPDEAGSGAKMCPKFLKKIDKARHLAGIPFHINSGYRSEAHNFYVGGRVGSSHLVGKACDVRCRNSHERSLILNAVIKVGFKRIGIADGFIHVDTDERKEDAIWLY